MSLRMRDALMRALDELRYEPTEPGPSPDVILHPGISLSTHSTAGDALNVRAAGETREAAAFRPADPDLARLRGARLPGP